jgi:hypothetical protein
MESRCPVWLLALVLAAPLQGQDGGGAVVQLADGSSVPLARATLSYEYVAWKQGTPQHEARPQRRDAPELWLAKKSYPVRGQSVEIVYVPGYKPREVDGETKAVKVSVANGIRLPGVKSPLKLEPPHKDLVLTDAERGLMLAVRTLDLRGETLTGTKREFCLLSFTALVECPDDAPNRVVRIDFQ